jgi:acetamidase/formamidase
MGVAPTPETGRVSSSPPGRHAGNLDNRELVVGSTLYIPVFVPGALFEIGDGHAAQGDGEVNGTAVETSLAGTFEFHVRKDLRWRLPRAQTPTHFITFGFDVDLDVAARTALNEMLDWLVALTKLSRDEAYSLSSFAVDLHITQTVNNVKGVHAMIERSILRAGRPSS